MLPRLSQLLAQRSLPRGVLARLSTLQLARRLLHIWVDRLRLCLRPDSRLVPP